MSGPRVIRLTVPGSLIYRDVAVRAVLEACALVGRADGGDPGGAGAPAATGADGDGENPQALVDRRLDLKQDFHVAVVSAFSEIYNNIALHAYDSSDEGDIEIHVALADDHLEIRITDQGEAFDIATVPPPDELPEHGMGIHLARMMLDELSYQPGPPNVWRLVKHVCDPHQR